MIIQTRFVCTLCRTAYYHPLRYCHKCPGKLEQRKLEIPLDTDYWRTKDGQEKYFKFLESQGLKDGDI